jgi:Domain of unknown function (DUF5916)
LSRARLRFLLCLAVGFAASPGLAASPTLHIPRVSRPPRIEDFLDHTARQAELVITGFRQFDPGDGTPASEPTWAYLSYDQKNLYVVFVCKSDPAAVRAHLARREEVAEDDVVGIALDTFHDRRRAYHFQSNPLGVQSDSIITEGQDEDFNFDTLWYSRGRLTPDGYIVWMAIPFKSLRFPDRPGQSWGVAVSRTIVRRGETSYWPYITRQQQGFVQQFATLDGLEDISPGHNAQVIPYGLFAAARVLDQQPPAFRHEQDQRGGLDSKFIFHDALTLDVTINPDFSQVESDDPQVTIDQRFRVFFPEKRPFFIENAGFFQTPINLFFSRDIADPQYGARLTGKLGRWTLGGLVIDDRAEGESFPRASPYFGDRAGIGVVRVQREFASQSSVGLLATSLDFGPFSNRVFGFDTRLKLTPHWVLAAQAVESYTHNLDGSQKSGPAYLAQLSFTGRHFSYTGDYSDISPNFESDLGFVPRVDVRQTDQFAGYFWRPERGLVQAFGPVVSMLLNWNRQGDLQDWQASAGFQVNLSGRTEFQVSRGEAFELFEGFGFRKHSTAIDAETEWWRWLALNFRYAQGDRTNYFPPAPLNPFLASSRDAQFGFTLRPTPRFRFDQTYIYERLGTLAGSTLPGTAPGASVFNNHLLRSKFNYQFTRELSLRTILDYNAVLANQDLVDLDTAFTSTIPGVIVPSKHFTADFLLTYLLHPGTAVYVGYTDNYENLNINPVGNSIIRTGSPTIPTGRQFFVKASYLFRF